MAGNQLGKTYCGAAEAAIHLTGLYPAWWGGRRFERPVRAWAGSKTGEVTRDGVQRLLVGEPKDKGQWGTGMIPGDRLLAWSAKASAPGALDGLTVRHVSSGTSTLGFKSYADPGGAWTIGYGHAGADVHAGMRITTEQAQAWLTNDLNTATARLAGVVKDQVISGLSDSQYAAVLSFVFNLGAEPGWTIWKRLNAGRLDLVPGEIMRFVYIGKTRSPGLATRRAAEVALWSSGEAGAAGDAPPSSYTRAEATPPAVGFTRPVLLSRTAVTGAAQLVGGISAGALAVQQTVAPYAEQAAVLGKLTTSLALFMAGCGVLLLAIKWLEHREAKQ